MLLAAPEVARGRACAEGAARDPSAKERECTLAHRRSGLGWPQTSPTKVYQLGQMGFKRIIPSEGVNGRGRFTMGLRRL